MLARPAHPAQLILIGLAECVFFLLLLSIAEQIGFAAAYAAKRLSGKQASPQARALLRLLWRSLPLSRSVKPNGQGIVYAFRGDGEAGGHTIPRGNVDLSARYEFGVSPRPIADSAVAAVLAVMRRADSLHTDRLHMAIAGALSGIRVHFYPNSYFKCRAVYAHSLAGRFDNVVWMGDST